MSGADGSQPLRLSPHAAHKRRRAGDVLVLPERAIRLAGSGGAILACLATPCSGDEVVARMCARHPTSDADAIAREVRAFLAQMQTLGAVVAATNRARPGTSPAGPAADEPAAAASAAHSAPTLSRSRDSATSATPSAASGPDPLNLIAELTYRCPLQCPYCSNPLDFRARREALDAEAWGRVFEEAAELGVVHLGLTGGEPSTRSDLETILERALAADLYPHLVTAGRPLTPERLDGLAARGLRSVQVSIQAAEAALSDRIAGTPSFPEKLAIARRTRALDLALTLNCVLHRENLHQTGELIELAIELGAVRLELANTQYHGWALRNRAALLPTREQLEDAAAIVEAKRERARAAGLSVLFVRPDYYAERPKPCMGGWGRLALVVDPTGLVLPCHEASELPGLEFWRAGERALAACWHDAPGMRAYRGTDWMPDPCRSCPDRERDFGGCRCQAFRLTGDARRADPACSLSPDHAIIVAARGEPATAFVPRR